MALFVQRPLDPTHSLSPSLEHRSNHELETLRAESDETLRSEGLLSFAGRQERAGREELAASIYAELEGSSVATRAQARLRALRGDGENLGLRAEVLLRRFVGQATDPAMLLGMGAAGTVFRATRAAVLARSGLAPTGLLTRGVGARATASLAAFGAEVPTFTLATRFGHEALGRSQDWSWREVGRDMGSGALLLGGMRLSGAALGSLQQRLGGGSPLLFRQAGMFSGIVLGHGLETAVGLREAQPLGTTLLDSFAMLLQFNVAGRLTQAAFGRHFASWERNLDQRAAELGQSFRLPRLPGDLGVGVGDFAPGLALAGRVPQRVTRAEEPRGPERTYMVGRGKEGYDSSGLEALRELRTMRFVDEANPERELRRWIDAQPMPIAVAVMQGTKLPPLQMLNQRFLRTFGVQEGDFVNRSITEILPKGTSGRFISSRVFSQMAGILLKGWAEFDPTPMTVLGRRAVGAGIYRKIGGQAYAFGVFTEIEGGNPAAASSPTRAPSLGEARPAVISRPLEPVDLSGAKAHFRAMREGLNPTLKKPEGEDPK